MERTLTARLRVFALLTLLSFAGLPSSACDRATSVVPAPTPIANPAPVAEPSASDPGRDTVPDDLPGLARIADPDERGDVHGIVLLIRAGRPFAYPDKDGSVFGNFERRLPIQARGYYREYTVRTPGISHRGARRIVAGRAAELFYTRDHYATFIRLTRP